MICCFSEVIVCIYKRPLAAYLDESSWEFGVRVTIQNKPRVETTSLEKYIQFNIYNASHLEISVDLPSVGCALLAWE